ncbi:MAG: PorV/PorQ family protein [Ignavibacteria bacterium]|nr:PorV/PorQ family protein [Ignavibacteria bacterium]
MRTTLKSCVAVAVVLVLAGASALAGGGNRVGTASADQLLIPVGARGIALGSSYTAGISGVNAIYFNPAGLSASTARAEATFSSMKSIGDIGVAYFAVGANFSGFGHLAFSVKSLSFGDIPRTDERSTDGSFATYSPTFVNIGLTYSRALTDRIRAGVTANIISETIDRVSASGVAFDIGVQYSGLAGVRGLGLGVTLKHLGANMKYDGPGLLRSAKENLTNRPAQLLKIDAAGFGLPTSLEIGLAYTAAVSDLHAVTMTGAFENNNYLADQYRVGAEYAFKNFFFLRGSVNIPGGAPTDEFDTSKNDYIYSGAFGAGVNYASGDVNIGLDYAYRMSEIFAGSHVFTINLGF